MARFPGPPRPTRARWCRAAAPAGGGGRFRRCDGRPRPLFRATGSPASTSRQPTYPLVPNSLEPSHFSAELPGQGPEPDPLIARRSKGDTGKAVPCGTMYGGAHIARARNCPKMLTWRALLTRWPIHRCWRAANVRGRPTMPGPAGSPHGVRTSWHSTGRAPHIRRHRPEPAHEGRAAARDRAAVAQGRRVVAHGRRALLYGRRAVAYGRRVVPYDRRTVAYEGTSAVRKRTTAARRTQRSHRAEPRLPSPYPRRFAARSPTAARKPTTPSASPYPRAAGASPATFRAGSPRGTSRLRDAAPSLVAYAPERPEWGEVGAVRRAPFRRRGPAHRLHPVGRQHPDPRRPADDRRSAGRSPPRPWSVPARRYRRADHRAAAPGPPGGRELGHPPGRLPERPALGARKQWRGARRRGRCEASGRSATGPPQSAGSGRRPWEGREPGGRGQGEAEDFVADEGWPLPGRRPKGEAQRIAAARPHRTTPALPARRRPPAASAGARQPPAGHGAGRCTARHDPLGASSEHCSSRWTAGGGTGPPWRAPSPRSSSG